MTFWRSDTNSVSLWMLSSTGAKPLPSPDRYDSAFSQKVFISSGLSVANTGWSPLNNTVTSNDGCVIAVGTVVTRSVVEYCSDGFTTSTYRTPVSAWNLMASRLAATIPYLLSSVNLTAAVLWPFCRCSSTDSTFPIRTPRTRTSASRCNPDASVNSAVYERSGAATGCLTTFTIRINRTPATAPVIASRHKAPLGVITAPGQCRVVPPQREGCQGRSAHSAQAARGCPRTSFRTAYEAPPASARHLRA